MSAARRIVVVLAAGAAALAAVVGAALAAGPTPGVLSGWDGIAAPAGGVRYVAVTSARDTVVERIDTRTGRVLRFGSIAGIYGIPLASDDGTATGLSRDGGSLVLSTLTLPDSGSTRFAIVGTKTLQVRQRVVLPGIWSLDALSPDGRTLFLIEYLPQDGDYSNYRVRAYDLAAGRLVPGAIVDRREPDAMTGRPMTRAASPDAAWAYTLYSRDAAAPAFVHALDTVHRAAVCIDLPWKAGPDALLSVRMAVAGGELVLTQRGARLATIDLRTYAVHALRAPVAAG